MKNVIETFLQGSRHSKNSIPCEDRTFSLFQNGVSAISLADGAGNKKYTHAAQGAECVCKEICTLLCTKFDEFYNADNMDLLRRAVMVRCQNALLKKAKELELDSIERLSSTLLAAAVKDGKAVFIHIGDGVIGKVTQNSAQVISEPQNGEFASTTYFITLANADEYIHIVKNDVGDDAVYFLMSDGTSEYCYNESDSKLLPGAAKMALMVYDDDGEDKLTDTVRNMLIKKDEYSDDCSFIALRVADKRPPLFLSDKDSSSDGENENLQEPLETEESPQQTEVAPPLPTKKELKEILETFDSADFRPQENKNKKPESKKTKNKLSSKAVIAIICAAALIVAVVVGVLCVKSNSDAEQSTTRSSNQFTAEEKKSDSGAIVTEKDSKAPATEKSSETSNSSYETDTDSTENDGDASSDSESDTSESESGSDDSETSKEYKTSQQYV